MTEQNRRIEDKRAEGSLNWDDLRASAFTAQLTQSRPADRYAFTITPRAERVGGGWRLQLFEDGQEVAGGMYPVTEEMTRDDAHADAMADGEAWLLSRGQVPAAAPASADNPSTAGAEAGYRVIMPGVTVVDSEVTMPVAAKVAQSTAGAKFYDRQHVSRVYNIARMCNHDIPDEALDEMRDVLVAGLAAPALNPSEVPQPELYTCIDKGGEYELLGEARGAGMTKGSVVSVYRDTTTLSLFYRTVGDFGKRMMPVPRTASKEGGADHG